MDEDNILLFPYVKSRLDLTKLLECYGLPPQLSGKELPANAGDTGSICGSGRYHEEGNGNPFQYSYLENPMDRGACWLWGHKASDMTE